VKKVACSVQKVLQNRQEDPESRDFASEWLPFSSNIALIWLQFGFNTAFSEDLGLLPDCCFVSFGSKALFLVCFSLASVLLQLCFILDSSAAMRFLSSAPDG